MKDLSETRINNVFQVPKGLWCFTVAEGIHLMATGGPDCLVFLYLFIYSHIYNEILIDLRNAIFVK